MNMINKKQEKRSVRKENVKNVKQMLKMFVLFLQKVICKGNLICSLQIKKKITWRWPFPNETSQVNL